MACGKFREAARVFGFDPTDVPFSLYLLKAVKQNVVLLGNLTWKSWLALSTIVVLNALRTKITPRHPSATDPDELLDESDKIINALTFIVLCGYGSLALFLYVYFSLQRRLRQYLMLHRSNAEAGEAAGEGGVTVSDNQLTVQPVRTKTDLDDPQSFLLWQNSTSTMSVLQIAFMFLVWYTAVFFLNIFYESTTFNIGFAVLFVIMALLPVAVFIISCPWLLLTISMLTHLGANLNAEWVTQILQSRNVNTTTAPNDRQEEKSQTAAATVRKRLLRPVLLDDATLMKLAEQRRQELSELQQAMLTTSFARPLSS